MSTITVNQASEYTVMRDSNRLSQRKINYADLVLYVKLKTLDCLAECSAIANIEEWAVAVNNEDVGDKVALSITAENEKVFTLVSWVETGESIKPTVIETPLSKAAYGQLLKLGVRGFKYRQHRFDIPYTKNAWLADVFQNHVGEDHPWIRLTLAAQETEMEMPVIPFPVEAYVFEYDVNNTPEEEQLIRDLWNRKWMSIGKS